MGKFHFTNLVGNYQISYSNVCPIHPVNGILLIRSSHCVGHESYCCDFGGFESRNNILGRFAIKALLWWFPRWEDDSHTDNERGV